jgi:hypothetical protein
MPLAPHTARSWSLWHPQQRLWNRPLVAAVDSVLARVPRVASLVVRLVVLVDSVILLGRVLRRRSRLLGARSLATSSRGRGDPVLHIDCGVHAEGDEIRLMRRWLSPRPDVSVLAFEAGSRQFHAAAAALRDVPSLDLRHEALVGPDHASATVTLHGSPADGGYGDSIFACGGPDLEDVPAVRLSEVLLSTHAAHAGPVILRMNIEGSELAVLEDVIAAGLHRRIDGYYGMWDDAARIDPAMDMRLRRLQHDHGIRPCTFNGRDLGYRLRRLAIRTDVDTSIRHGESRGHRPIADARP